jgi:putative SOS response-associated peptidase YedK
VCNLYSITRSQEAIGRAFRVMRDRTGNLPSLPAVYPDSMAPVVHTATDGERELSMMRWGFPPPPNLGKAPVTNVRNMKSPYWRKWLKAEWALPYSGNIVLRVDRSPSKSPALVCA